MRTLTTTQTLETVRLVTLGQEQGWDFHVLGQAPMPIMPVNLGDWLIVPAHQDASPLPERTRGRIQTIFAAGLRPKGFVVVHEAPKLLPAAAQQAGEEYHLSTQSPAREKAMKLLKKLPGFLLAGLLVALGATVLAIIVAALLSAILVVGGVALLGTAFAAVDPILIAVMEDGTWVEIDRWWTS